MAGAACESQRPGSVGCGLPLKVVLVRQSLETQVRGHVCERSGTGHQQFLQAAAYREYFYCQQTVVG